MHMARAQVLVLKSSWHYVEEKVSGIVALTTELVTPEVYELCEPHLVEILSVLHRLYETMRQCEMDQLLTWHIRHPDYTKATKKQLKTEASDRLSELLWKLSTEVRV